MNNLSWLLYVADVIGNVQGVFVFLSILAGLLSLVWGIAYACSIADPSELGATRFKNIMWFVPWLFVFFMLIASIIPSTETLYLIAGSEAGEAVVTSEEGKEILNDIREVIKGQLDTLKPQQKE